MIEMYQQFFAYRYVAKLFDQSMLSQTQFKLNIQTFADNRLAIAIKFWNDSYFI